MDVNPIFRGYLTAEIINTILVSVGGSVGCWLVLLSSFLSELLGRLTVIETRYDIMTFLLDWLTSD